MKNSYINELKIHLKDTGISLMHNIFEFYKKGDYEYLDKFAKEIGEKINTRITIIDTMGNPLADSKENPRLMENHRDRPEIITALNGDIGSIIRYSKTLKEEMLYVALPIYENGRVIGVLRTSIFMKDVNSLLSDLRERILILTIGVLIFSWLIAILISKSVTDSLKGLLKGFKKLASFDFETRIFTKRVEFIEVPIAYDGITVVVNRDNTWCNEIKLSELKKLWEPDAQGKIKKWSQIRNGWPDKEIHLFGPGVDSGTYDYFTEAIVGKEGASRGDFVASEDDNVLVQGISSDPIALGFFGYAYYEENKDILKAVAIDPEDGRGPVLPTIENIMNGKYFPLSRPLFLYINVKSLQKIEVQKFVEFYLKNTKKIVKEVGYIPLSDKAYELALERVRRKIKGSVFGGEGSKIGVKIEEILKIEK
ncbi:MAG: substrate-binding domain-containing protein [candidate division WOR-3 bacterium]